MADNISSQRVYPKRLQKKKPFFDEEPWKTVENKKFKNRKSVENSPNSNKAIDKPHCGKCLQVFKRQRDLTRHQEQCLRIEKGESFLKYVQNRKSDPRVIVEKLVIPPSQQAENAEVNSSPARSQDVSYASVTKGSTIDPTLAKAAGAASSNGITGADNICFEINSEGSNVSQTNEPESRTTDPPPETPSPPDSVENAYEEIVKWRRNLFSLPKGSLGKKFLDYTSKNLNNWCSTEDNRYLKMCMIMPSLLLQRTAKKCKARVNKDNLTRRLALWEAGKISELVEEGKCIQSRIETKTINHQSDETIVKKFRNHMLQGNVNAALRLLSNTGKAGLLNIDEESIRQLHEKHPEGEPLNEEMLLSGPIKQVHPVIFDDITEEMVQKVALRTKGAAGPSNFDASDWRAMLVSKVFGASSSDLCSAVVNVAKKLCSKDVNQNVSALMACRLIPLDKNPGLRPIGIGEVLRRIIGKMVVMVLRPDLQENAGDLQLCAGQESGCEAGIHAMHQIFEDDSTQGVIQVDANNAFNTINRNVFLHNMQIICPEFSIFINNCYQQPARLFVVGGIEILSQEGTTQGDPGAMYVYGLGLVPLILVLSELEARQSAFADDLAGGGTLEQLRKWWDVIIEKGKYIGYTAKPSKSWLIVKPEFHDLAVNYFDGTGIKITTEGKRHLGAVVGSQQFKETYVNNLIDEWVEELKNLQKVALIEPHLAYSAYIFGFQHKYTYFLRTIPDISNQLKRLDTAIDDQFLKPILNNYEFTYAERQWYSLPARKGGLGIIVPSEVSDFYYQNSKGVTAQLVHKIVHQKQPNVDFVENNQRHTKALIYQMKQQREDDKLTYVKSTLNPQRTKILEAITEKGASSWLTAMPVQDHGFHLSKQEFWDSIKIRYGIPLSRLPTRCVCGEKFSVEHAFTCKTGGFVSIRHNEIRDFTAEVLKEVCQDVEVEPPLTPLTGERFQHKTALTDESARPDVAARGVWTRGSRAFFDVRVFNPLAPSYRNQTLTAAHRSNENAKKRCYRERIQQVEHGSFTPLVFTCFGGMSVECRKFYNHISDKLSEKRDIAGSLARAWVRTKLCFSLLRTAHLCVRGSRTLRKNNFAELSSTNIAVAAADSRVDGNN